MKPYLLVFVLLALLAGCSSLPSLMGVNKQRVDLQNSSISPAAQGKVTINTDRNDNVNISLKVEHLAPPENLEPPRLAYVVWAQTPDGKNFNLGQLQVNTDREAELYTTTSLQNFRLIVTAEKQSTTETPSDEVVLASQLLNLGK